MKHSRTCQTEPVAASQRIGPAVTLQSLDRCRSFARLQPTSSAADEPRAPDLRALHENKQNID